MSSHVSASDPRIAKALQTILDRGVTGVSVTAYLRGKPVIEGTAGYANVEKDRLVDKGTIFPVFSTTKGITALAVHIQAEKGLLRLDDPISKHWPEFAANGKEAITVKQALSHRSGIPQMPEDVTPELMADWEWMTNRIANYTPIFPPGESNAYHVLVYGWLLGEIVRRTDPERRPFGQFVKQEIFERLGVDKGIFYGVPDSELERVATLYGKNQESIVDKYNVNPLPVFPGPRQHNLRSMLQAVDPGAGAVTNSASLARIFSMLAEGGELDGVRILSPERVKTFSTPREGVHDIDEIFTGPVPFGAYGFWVRQEGMSDPLVGDHDNIIYSPGAGGSIVWADLRDRLSVAIVNNHMDAGVSVDPEPIWAVLGRAVREVIADLQG
ncbi:hypothetical protein BHE90_010021 [Fusarium euwallaceae]|uniref:Beta-lactamase-related domain-containing protein n=1 Tax=Fusarium euwallaceae TaxID=1147111 RepID=A0A430LIE7_9HYPO|nr:hypothetical protein BHE90_010021 [Fusarium euwallaceae]